MLNKLNVAVKELANYYPVFNNLKVNEFIKGNKTSFKDGILTSPSLNQALFYLIHNLNGFEVEVNNSFDTFGTMIDLSRNAVFKVSYMKEVIRKKALLGVNKIMLYMEDVYYVEGEPYFGYMRGRYSHDELREIVKYAKLFDIEIIPSIQTLGHFGQLLKWGHNAKLKDLPTVILARSEETTKFITKLIKTMADIFETKEIHIGMDETFGLGFGQFYKNNGYVPQYEIFIEHLKLVNAICLDYGFKDVMIWSDMFFRISSKNNEYYDLDVNVLDKYKKAVPSNVKLVYWDYYNSNPEIVDKMIKKHQEFNNETVFASGTWIWTKLAYDKVQTDKTAKVHIDKSIENNLSEIYFTQWNDDGSPANYDTSFLGVYEMAVYAFINDKLPVSKVFTYINGSSYEEQLLVAKINESPIQPLPLLWDDSLNGIYLNNEVAKNANIIDETIKFFNSYINELKDINECFDIKHNLIISNLLKSKLIIRKDLWNNYHNKKSLLPIIDELNIAINLTEELLLSFRKMWLKRNKAFGLDVIQARLASMMYRFKETIMRINDYENKVIDKIDELEEEIGPYQPIRMNHMNVAFSSVHILSY